MIERMVSCDRVVIASVDMSRGLFTPFHISGVSVPVWDLTPIHAMGQSLIGEAVLSSTPVMSSRIPSHYAGHGDSLSDSVPTDYWESAMGMRIVNSGEIIGAVVFFSHETGVFGHDEILAAEQVSRIFAPYLAQHTLQKEVLRATEHSSNLDYLLRHLNDNQNPETFFKTFYSVFAARASLVYGVMFSVDQYSGKYVPIAHVDGIHGDDDLVLDQISRLVNDQRVTDLSVSVACEHKSVPTSDAGTGLMKMVSASEDFKELCLIPLNADMDRVGAIFFAMSDCNPSTLDRIREIESAGPIASAFLRLQQTSRISDRQQHIATMLQYAVEGLCGAPGVRQKIEVFDDFLVRSLGASEYAVEINHRITGITLFRREYPIFPASERVSPPGAEILRVTTQLGDTHNIEVTAVFDPDTSGLSPHHELRAVIRVCASILGTEILADPGSITAPKFASDTALAACAKIGTIPGGLSDREVQILKLLSHGATNDEIATYCDLASGTVKNKLVSIYKKLGVRNRSQASRAALLLDGERL